MCTNQAIKLVTYHQEKMNKITVKAFETLIAEQAQADIVKHKKETIQTFRNNIKK
jgi:Spy/CpxP family protein refolding chaperone